MGYVFLVHMLRQYKKEIIATLCFLGIVALSLVVTFSVDIYVSVELIFAQPASLTPMFGLYAISLLVMYFSVSLFTIFDRIYSSKVVRKNMVHSFIYVIAIILVLSFSEYTQYMFVQQTLDLMPNANGVTNTIWSMMFTRSLLFALGSPFIAYGTCVSAINIQKKNQRALITDKALQQH